MIISGSLKLIGNTPLIKLKNIVPNGYANVWLKYEAGNPTGSYKDRMALSVIRNAIEDGKIKKGDKLIEYTGGSAGSSLAFVSAALGLKFIAVFSDAFSNIKKQSMEAFGAEVLIEKSFGKGITPELIQRMKETTFKISKDENIFYVDQFGSPNVIKGYIPMGKEILSQIGKVDVFCASVGTAGALMGTYKGLNSLTTSIIVFEPSQSPFISSGKGGAHKVEGIGVGFMPPFLDKSLIKEIITIDQEDAFNMCKRLAKEEGIFCGASTGMNVFGAIKIAGDLGKDYNVVTLGCDNGIKYLGTHIYN